METKVEASELRAGSLPRVRNWAVALAALAVVGGFAGLFELGWAPRQKRLADLNTETAAVVDARPIVEVSTPKRNDKAADLVLPADARSLQETLIYPRANGYLKRTLVDIGDHVEAGQLLAEIDTPDVDADLNQSKAAQVQAEANVAKAQSDLALGEATLKRYDEVVGAGGVTKQQVDEKRAAVTQAQAALDAERAGVKSAEATVQRLKVMQGFEKITAPFAGTITARGYDIGALVSATNSSAKELFRIADTSVLRVFVNVPQPYVNTVKTGQSAFLSVRNFAGREFAGTIARSAGTLDPATRTLRYEIDVPNRDGSLYAGMYGQVRLVVNEGHSPIIVPTSALIFDAGGTRLWVVDGGKVHSKKVTVGQDLGTEIEIADGLAGNESIVTNPGEHLTDGAEVQLVGTEVAPKARPQQAAAR